MDEYLQPLSLELNIRTSERHATDTGMHFRQPYMLSVDAQHELRHGRAWALAVAAAVKRVPWDHHGSSIHQMSTVSILLTTIAYKNCSCMGQSVHFVSARRPI